ncbi:hypothetical protein V5N11_035177 [Cardamine amara subsp. amara]|uniref:Uncharacterized protein n=1 Tax=Cardamine amara subsp. amara TaxID=228776 RepID=A0ABD0ZIB1_CARAN
MSNDGGVDGGGADDIGYGSIPRKSKYDILRNKWGSFKRLNNFTGVSVDHSTGVITMDTEWWDDREKEIKYAKDIKENGIPHMELMRRIFGRQGSKPEAMYPTHAQGPKNADETEGEPMDKSVPITQDNDADDSNLNPTTDFWWACIKVLKEDPFAREMMVYSESDDDRIRFMEGYTGYDRAEYYIGDRLNKLESCKGYYPIGNLEQDMENTNVESHKEFDATSHTDLMSLFRDIGYTGRVGNTDPDGESSQTTINLEH